MRQPAQRLETTPSANDAMAAAVAAAVAAVAIAGQDGHYT